MQCEGGCDGPGIPAWGASKDPVFVKKSGGKYLKITEKVKNKIKKVMTLGIQDIWGGASQISSSKRKGKYTIRVND